jgi:channel protein (hemolysin III family)
MRWHLRSLQPAMAAYSIPGFSEPFSSLSHLLGAGIFAVLGIVLLRRGRGSTSRLVTLGIFVVCCVFLLSMSGVYHLLTPAGVGRQVLQRLDHAAIFALIAGSFTPIHWILFTGWGRWGVLALIWGLAITGITLKVIFFDSIPEWLGLASYLTLGWIGLASGMTLWRRYGIELVKRLIYSGLSYTAGGVLEFLRMPTLIPGVLGPHELLHIGVMAGIGFHFRFLFGVLRATVAPPPADVAGPLGPHHPM